MGKIGGWPRAECVCFWVLGHGNTVAHQLYSDSSIHSSRVQHTDGWSAPRKIQLIFLNLCPLSLEIFSPSFAFKYQPFPLLSTYSPATHTAFPSTTYRPLHIISSFSPLNIHAVAHHPTRVFPPKEYQGTPRKNISLPI